MYNVSYILVHVHIIRHYIFVQNVMYSTLISAALEYRHDKQLLSSLSARNVHNNCHVGDAMTLLFVLG